MSTKIGNIATVHSGVYAKTEFDGDVYYIQARQFNNKLEFERSAKPELRLEGKIANNTLKPGDILLAAKGNNNFAVEWRDQVNPAVASSMFIIIRIKKFNMVTPGFITWYLNLPISQTYFQNNAKGTSMVSLTKDIIENMEIPLPSLKQQKAIEQLYNLRNLERSITRQLDELRETYLQNVLLTAIN